MQSQNEGAAPIDDLSQLIELQDRVLASVRGALRDSAIAELSRSVRDDDGATVVAYGSAGQIHRATDTGEIIGLVDYGDAAWLGFMNREARVGP